ncbi:MAG TPA: MBL fold metallo-hydrolase [Puia sp.]|nr:MBL fold metallo-hydrolase [Puia sp.]
MALFKAFGKAPAGARLERMRRSPNYKVDRFENLVPTEVTVKGTSFFKMLREYRNRPADTAPAMRVPSMKTDLRSLPDEGVWIVWFGHSSYLLKVEGVTILVDPVFSGNAAPVSFLAKAFEGTDAYGVEAMPEIDVLLLTHDHYDHLDYKTVKALAPKVGRVCTSLGVGAHLELWGVPAEKIVELDWWESWGFGDDDWGRVDGAASALTLMAAPARHFSGRSFKRAGTLWSSFVLKGRGHSLYLGGDSGYERHFREIGERCGPFELAILECGQYGKNWPYIHMMPEQTVQAAVDLGAAALMPVHWGKFTLALHPWNEPVRRLVAAFAKGTALAEASVAGGQTALRLATPMIGQPVLIGGPYPDACWWDIS